MQLVEGVLKASGQGQSIYVYDDTTGYQSASPATKNTFIAELGDKLQYSSIVVGNLEENYQIPDFESYVEI